MRFILPILSILMMVSGLAGCAQPAATPEARNPFYVPSTWLLHRRQSPPTRLAFQVLPGSRVDEFFVPRGEKFAYGSMPLAAVSAYSVLTYDAQRISSPGGVGFRYTWAVREGVDFP